MPSTTYTVTRQQPDVYDFTSPGDPVLGTQVYFTTGGGNSGSVFIPQSKYNGTHVRAAVAAAAKNMDDIGGIHGTAD
jgi:hypothetical protein